jgi:WD40 repeat protein
MPALSRFALVAGLTWMCGSVPPASCQEPRTDRHGDGLPDGAVARLGTIRLRHPDGWYPITTLFFSPDGNLIASGSSTDQARVLWDVTTGELVRRFPLPSHNGKGSAAFGPGGKWLITTGDYNPIRVWEVASGREVPRFGPEIRQREVGALSPDGTILATGRMRLEEVELWDVAGGRLGALRGQADWGTLALVFSPDGNLLASAGHLDKIVRLWDLRTGALAGRLEGHACHVDCLAFSADGKRLASGSRPESPSLYLWDVATGKGRELRSS